ncbi:DEAD/DEAH box helicase [Rubrimonas cliftonensis]|uniref:DEAD-box ATP-dependent RNA helicase RhpA n=1 Tax=Rubrimonas cliftonensis TaxID=89524 RepID=A0A1H3ZC00_9RHOB|nr:DEAD/DEAH box helicase [Rubrimonas cliftonensis]SEA21286.1 Superfamily II DNA and RNA helicase [Rubrimonas cliftonensis]
MTFEELNLDPNVLKAVREAGYTQPTPIQSQAIPHALTARDVLGIAQTGTGKTAAFTMPMITLLNKGRARARMPRSLILCPTRELAAQVAENFDTYGKYCKLSKALLIGGVSFGDQDRLIDRGVDVLIATPGRLLDHFERGKLMLTGIEVMVVDEADRMLDMGFIPDIERIFKLTPFTRQTLFFSATMPPEITRLTEEFLSNPVRVEVAPASSTAENVTQRLCRLHPSKKENADREKRDLLVSLLRDQGDALKNAIIFCNRKRDIGAVHKSLDRAGFAVGALHGDLDQSVRTATLDGFRDGSVRLLVASDVAARGLDIPSVSHVINFDVPIHSEDYVHRIGRTGRAGRSGLALTIVLPHEEKHVDKIEKLIEKTLESIDPPGGDAPRPARAPSADPTPEAEPSAERSRPRRSRRAADVKAPATIEAEAEAPAAAEPEAAQVARAAPTPEPQRHVEPRRNDGRRGRGDGRRDRADRGEPVIGFGDHPPAFVMRPVVLPKATRSAAVSESEEADEAA